MIGIQKHGTKIISPKVNELIANYNLRSSMKETMGSVLEELSTYWANRLNVLQSKMHKLSLQIWLMLCGIRVSCSVVYQRIYT